MPASTDPDADPEQHISHIYDNRARIDTRVKLLQTGHRYSPEPASLMRRLIGNVEVDKIAEGRTHDPRAPASRRRSPDEQEEGRADQRGGAAC